MGLTFIDVTLINPEDKSKEITEQFLVDSGATYTMLPASILEEIGVEPSREMNFVLADGTVITRSIGDVFYEINGTRGAAPIIFGEENDSNLLGAVTLEALGLILDPFKRELKPMKMVL